MPSIKATGRQRRLILDLAGLKIGLTQAIKLRAWSVVFCKTQRHLHTLDAVDDAQPQAHLEQKNQSPEMAQTPSLI
jgi:hypothetical protein